MKGLGLALEESFAWQMIAWQAKDQWRRGKIVFVVILVLMVAFSGLRFETLAAALILPGPYVFAVLFAAILNYVIWIAFGRLLTTGKEREALSAKERVKLSHDIWWRPARPAKGGAPISTDQSPPPSSP